METLRIICPDSHFSRSERIALTIREFDKWVSDEHFVELVSRFGGTLNLQLSAVDKIKWLKESFTDIWDYRKKQKNAKTREGEAARWLLQNNEQVAKHQDFIYETARRLGLIGTNTTLFEKPDYYLPLGGARMSNLRRCELAAQHVSHLNHPVTVVALSGMRPIAESERKNCMDTYAPDAVTEYDAMIESMKQAFSPLVLCKTEHREADNPNLTYYIKEFSCTAYRDSRFFTVAAPSTVPERRANSADCFTFFFDNFNIPKHSRLVNCTGQIYCTYQQVRALFLAIDHEVEFDTIGFPFHLNEANADAHSHTLAEPVNYLQEIKATIDAMYDFVLCYSKNL